MPHLVTHRPRLTNPASSDISDPSHKAWETFDAFSYELGGVMFVAGSVFFFPALSAYLAVGDWLFFAGSILYLLVTGHDLLEVLRFWHHYPTTTFADHIELGAAICYVLGSLLFVIGSLCFLPGVAATAPGAWMFIIGSVLFVAGGMVNVLQVVEAPSLIYMQLFNITIALFVIGSALFVVASIPYLWRLAPAATQRVDTYDAAQFLAGSILFLIGGMAIYYRKLVNHRLETYCRASGLGTMFISKLRSEIRDKGHLGPIARQDQERP